ncbi:MAG TPA: cysteine desulfurase family protein, partial [Candidatus Atribacteria bacterium]|nr:cysteine desulfurase family protein [Candidatus Atribacteria bacterium]
PDRLEKEIRPDTTLVSIMHVNNEIGSIQPIEQLGRIIKSINPNTVFHVDAIQSFGKLGLYPKKWGIDLLSLSGHKIHAPKGIGALYVKKGVRLQPILFGGGQQRGYRSGTENIAGIAGLGAASKFIRRELETKSAYLYDLKNRLVAGLKDALPQAVINGSLESGAPHIVNIGFPGMKGEVLLHALEDEGVFVSTGSACSSRDRTVSHVLKAVGVDDRIAGGSIRVSTSYLTTMDEIDAFISILASVVSRVEKYSRR